MGTAIIFVAGITAATALVWWLQRFTGGDDT